MDKLPIYDALISDENDGLLVMSLVDMPATEKDWVCFKQDKQIMRYAVQDEEEHILCGVAMLADTPIYRRDAEGREFYIRYSKDTLKLMAEKALFDNTLNNIDVMHNGDVLPRGVVALRELFLKDVEKGINPTHFEDVPDGSLLCTYKVNDSDLWEMCKDGTFNGFSLEGMFSIARTEEKYQNNKKDKSIFMSIKEAIAKLLTEYSKSTAEDGTVLVYDGEALEIGVEVSTEAGEAVADGEYAIDGSIVVVKDGKVEDIKEKEEEPAEEPVAEEPAEETDEEMKKKTKCEDEEEPVEEPVEEEPEVNEIEALKSEVEALKAELEALKGQIADIVAQPAVEPVTEEFEKANKPVKVSRAVEIAKALRS